MKVTHLNKRDDRGGAEIAAFRINESLDRLCIDSKMVVENKSRQNQDVKEVVNTKLQKEMAYLRSLYNQLLIRFLYRNKQNAFISAAKWGVDLSKNDIIQQSDVINLHAIVNGFLSLKSIQQLGKLNKPLVWTLHDQWAFTGGCHYSRGCSKFKERCGECPLLNSTRENDITRKIWKKKEKIYRELDLTVVAPSRWLASQAKESSLLKNLNIRLIPNTLDTDTFKPVPTEIARHILNLPKNKILILFGAIQGTRAKRKGFDYLREGLKILNQNRDGEFKSEIELAVFGSQNGEAIPDSPFKTTFLGYLHDNYSLALCYSAADLFVGPSLQETFGQTFSEVMACGTPPVAFDHFGPKDIIDHKETGYLSDPKSPESLAEGITWGLKDEERLKELGGKARAKARDKYDMRTAGEQYRDLYVDLIS